MGNDIEEIGDLIHRALTYGIKLSKMTRQEGQDYLLTLSDFVNKGKIFRGVYSENEITIETKYMDPVMMIRIRKDTLEFMPLSETSFFDSFIAVLGFISTRKKEEELMKEFKIFVDEVDKDMLIDKEIAEEEKKEIINDTDDFDWI